MDSLEDQIVRGVKLVEQKRTDLIAEGYAGGAESGMQPIREELAAAQGALFSLMREFLGDTPDPSREDMLRRIMEGPMEDFVFTASQSVRGKVDHLLDDFKKDYRIVFK